MGSLGLRRIGREPASESRKRDHGKRARRHRSHRRDKRRRRHRRGRKHERRPGSAKPPPPAATTPPPPRRPACNNTVSGSSTVAGALSSASPGSAVCLSAGSYTTLTLDNINPAGNVTLEPAEGAAVEIEGMNMASDSNLTIIGFELHAGIDVREQDSNLIFSENLTRESECGYFLYGEGNSGISNVQILDNRMEDLDFTGPEGTCSGEGVVFIGKVSNLTIDGNTIGPHIANHYTHTGGVQGLREDGNTFLGPSLRSHHGSSDHQNILQIFGSSTNVEFSNNVMRDTETNAGSLLFQEGQMYNVKVDNNLFDHDAEGYSVQIYPVEGLEFAHNTVVDSHWGVYFRQAEPPRDSSYGDNYDVVDNIFVGNTGGTPDVTEKGCSSACTFDYNVSGDRSATGPHSVDNWAAHWSEAPPLLYQPLGLPIEAGYRVG